MFAGLLASLPASVRHLHLLWSSKAFALREGSLAALCRGAVRPVQLVVWRCTDLPAGWEERVMRGSPPHARRHVQLVR